MLQACKDKNVPVGQRIEFFSDKIKALMITLMNSCADIVIQIFPWNDIVHPDSPMSLATKLVDNIDHAKFALCREHFKGPITY